MQVVIVYCPFFIDFASILHPVHIVTKDNHKSQSALIPFCEFGGNMSAIGIKIDQFEWPVCNSFEAKILNDQLCYEIDLNRFADKDNIQRQLKLGFNFIMDYNEDRQVTFDNVRKPKELGITSSIVNSHMENHALIYLNTIGKPKKKSDMYL